MDVMKNKRVAYLLYGNFDYISRAKKQINSLLNRGFDVRIFNGVFSEIEMAAQTHYNIKRLKINQGKSRLTNFFSILQFNFQAHKEILKSESDFIICRELSVLVAGVLAKKKRPDLKLIFDNNELSIETHSGIKKRIWGYIQKICLLYCDVVIHAEKNRMEYFIKQYGLENQKGRHYVLENYPLMNRNTLKKINNNRVLYFGSISESRNIPDLIEAFAELKNVELDLVGFGSEEYLAKLTQQIQERDITHIKILPPIDDSGLYDLLRSYSIGIAFYPHVELNNYYCAPNKVFQYIQGGLTLITTDNPGLKEIIDEHKIGQYVTEVTAKDISRAVHTIIDQNLMRNIDSTLQKKYCWENIEKNFLSIFENELLEQQKN